MSTIHQIYCTHCTHGSSALERREGELAGRTLGYSARAGSLESSHLRRYYRQIERYVYYYLPRDTPGHEKLRLAAASAPRRLVYYPSTGGLQIVAQICYRQADTQGRPGSYFAHLLFREEKDGSPRWSPLECLKLWGAPGWVEEDAPEIPFLLAPLGSLEEMLGGRRPAIDDTVLLSFLRTPADGSFDDPAGTIPERWRRMDPSRRRDLFADALQGLLEITPTRRESLVMVVEPGVAALVFYGILRLLPVDRIRDGISLSTFEPNTDRLGTSLAGTWFFDPQRADLRPDAYRSHGFAINTYSGRRTEYRRPRAQYAQTIVKRLLEQGWEAADWTLASLRSVGARGAEDLDALAAVDRWVPTLFDPRQTSIRQDWRRSPMAAGYLRRALGRYLVGLKDPKASLEPIVGRPAHLTILELLAAGPQAPGTQAVAEFLLSKLPGGQIAELLGLDAVPPDAKIAVLARYVTAHGDLPPGCDHLWNEPAQAAGSRGPGAEPMLPRLLGRLDVKTLERFYRQSAGQHSDTFLIGLLSACRDQPSTQAALTAVVKAMDEKALLALFRSLGPALLAGYPENEPALGARLHEMLGSLARHPRQFPQRLDLIFAGRHRLPNADQEIAAAWDACRRAILEVGSLQAQKSGILRQPPLEKLEAACRAMAQAAVKAMPSDRFDDDAKGSQKQKCLRLIGQRLLGGKPLLPGGAWYHKALWQKIAWHFENGKWPSAPLKKMAPKSRSLKSNWTLLAGLVAGLFVAGLLGVLSLLRGPQPTVGDAAATSDSRDPIASQAAADRRAAQRTSFREARTETGRAPDGRAEEHEQAKEPTRRPPEEEPKQPAAYETAPSPAERPTAVADPSGQAVSGNAQPETAAREGVAGQSTEVQPAKPEPAAQTAASVDGRVEVTARPTTALRAAGIAQVRPMVTGDGGAPLPSWLREKLVTGCLIIAQDADGFLSRPVELSDVDGEQIGNVPAGTVAVSVRFRFLARSAGPGDQQGRTVATTGWYVIERVEAAVQYTIRLELSPSELDWLHLLAEGSDPGGP